MADTQALFLNDAAMSWNGMESWFATKLVSSSKNLSVANLGCGRREDKESISERKKREVVSFFHNIPQHT